LHLYIQLVLPARPTSNSLSQPLPPSPQFHIVDCNVSYVIMSKSVVQEILNTSVTIIHFSANEAAGTVVDVLQKYMVPLLILLNSCGPVTDLLCAETVLLIYRKICTVHVAV